MSEQNDKNTHFHIVTIKLGLKGHFECLEG